MSVNKEYAAEAFWEAFEERAGIMEYGGGLPREEAERLALDIVLEEFKPK